MAPVATAQMECGASAPIERVCGGNQWTGAVPMSSLAHRVCTVCLLGCPIAKLAQCFNVLWMTL